MRNHLRQSTLRARRPYRGPILNRQRRAARLHLVTVQRLSLAQSASCRTSVNQVQSIHCPGQRTHRPVSYRASARDLINCQIKSGSPSPETMVQLCLVIQEVWDGIPHARIPHLSPFMPRRCRVVHEAHVSSPNMIDLAALNSLLHRTKCPNTPLFTNDGSPEIDCWFNPYQIISEQFSQLWNSPLKLMCVSILFSK